jgi:hypothetical protein
MREAEQAFDPSPPASESKVEPVAYSLMQLQRTAGNKAVGSLLARDADKADAQEKGTNATLVMPDPIGVISLESYSMAGPEEIAVTAASSGADPSIFRAGANGTYFAVVKLSNPYLEITLQEVIISSVQISGGHIMFKVNAAKTEIATPDAPKGKIG